MKKVAISVILYFLIGLVAFSQEISPNKVPIPVKQAFAKQFPAARAVIYELDKTDYQIGFQEQGKECIATYNAAGKLLGTDKEIASNRLPKEVSSAVAQNFPGYTIITVVKREASDKGICFEMDLKKDDAGYSVRFSDKGEILQKVARKVQFKVTTRSKR
ncbi:MAG: PepSY-like domain-containing protein [Bacteroidales bacterium]